MNNTVIAVENLSKSFGDIKAVDNIGFRIRQKECFGFLGPNGAGKTTTLKILTGKSTFTKNKDAVIDVMGFHPANDSLSIKALSGIVPQQDNLDAELNVKDNLLIYSKFYDMNSRQAKERIDMLLEFMELKDRARSRVHELSGGMKRRLTIARALLNSPRLLILDEPTTGLDPQVRHLIWNKLRELKGQGVTILLTTHYMEEAYQICDRILIMDKGRKLLEGSPRQLLEYNIEKYVLEVYGVSSKDETCTLLFERESLRFEFHNETVFVYSNESDKLSRAAADICKNNYHIRLSNLEDVFLKVTGRILNELQ